MKRFLTVVVLLIATAAFAQMGPPKPVKQIEAISKLDYMKGQWTGEGWIIMAGQKLTFKGSETVTPKLDNSVLLVEGNFTTRRTGGTVDIPVHVTLGVISFDPATSKYRFHSWTGVGGHGERELVVTDKGWSWDMTARNGLVRYTFSLTEDGAWHETGEHSADEGKSWKQFFEMSLRK
jgi:hypothetical protein